MYRSFLFTAFVYVLAVTHPLVAQEAATEQKTEAKAKILLIGHELDHPFGSHMYLHECHLLAKCLNQSPGVEAVVSDRWPKDPSVLRDVKALVFYSSPGANLLLEGPHTAQAEKLLSEGVGYTAVHWGTGANGQELGERYLRILGGWFDLSFGGLDVSPSRVQQIDSEHPICRGWKEYELRDEWYLNTRLVPEAKPLLKVPVKLKDDVKEQIVAWVYERPKSHDGRSFGITLGHFHDNFGNESFRRTIVNGILWTAHRDIPEGGAPVDVTAADMDLGANPQAKK